MINKLPNDFDWKIYQELNPDLRSIKSKKLVEEHYIYYGFNENRKYKTNNPVNNTSNTSNTSNNPTNNPSNNILPNDFNWKIYQELNPDLRIFKSKKMVEEHYIMYGIIEKRQYKSNNLKKNTEPIENTVIKKINMYSNVSDELTDNIIIIACCPKNLVYINTISKIIKYFKKIYVIYNEKDVKTNFKNQSIFNNEKIILLKSDNDNYFNKYLIGIIDILDNNEIFNKIWLINDNLIIFDWENIFNKDIIKKINYNDYLGLFQSSEKDKLIYFYSYFLILNKNIMKNYYEKLLNYKENNDIEIILSNSLISNKNIKSDSIFENMNNIEIYHSYVNKGIYKNISEAQLKLGIINNSNYISTINNIYNINYLKSVSFTEYLTKVNNRYEKIINLYINLYEPFIKIFNFFYMKKIVFEKNNDYFNMNNKFKIAEIMKKNNIPIKMFDYYKKKNGESIKSVLSKKINCNVNDIIDSLNLISYIKTYTGDNQLFIDIKKNYLYKSDIKTSVDALCNTIKNLQFNTKNKKLVYTNNINSYDIFWDIDDNLVESDTDYIYISNVCDENVCKNFTYIYCNIDSTDSFYLNRYIKFNKRIFKCYDKILYIDSNVKINQKLNNFFELLNEESDLVLFKHPERENLNQEINKIIETTSNYSKWDIDKNKMIQLVKDNEEEMNNNLFWLNVQLSNTNYNIYNDFSYLYKKYNLKRDQIYFSIIQNKYKIKIIDINFNLRQDYQDKNITNFDGDYGYIEYWSNYFSRPFGGSHL
jgi:hypothetical protein